MLNKSSTSKILIALFVISVFFAVLSILFATSILEGSFYADPTRRLLDNISGVSFIFFMIAALKFAIISYSHNKGAENLASFKALEKHLAKKLRIGFKKKRSIMGLSYDGQYNGQRIAMRLMDSGGTTVPSNFVNISIYHSANLNMGLTMRSKNITLLFKGEYRDLMARRITLKEPVYNEFDIFAIRQAPALNFLYDSKVIGLLEELSADLKTIGAQTGISNKIFGTGSGISVTDSYICIRIFDDILEPEEYDYVVRLISSASKLSKLAVKLKTYTDPSANFVPISES